MQNYSSLARHNMVEGQLRPNQVLNSSLLNAMRKIPREHFVPKNVRGVAYVDTTIPLGHDRYLMEPCIFARLIQAVDIKESDVVLDIGCGTGYSTAILAELAGTVIAVENNAYFVNQATTLLNKLDIENTLLYEAPLTEGYPEQAPYDIIVIEGKVAEVPEEILEQLTDQGRLVTVVTDKTNPISTAKIFQKIRGKIFSRTLFTANIPYLKGFESKPRFHFGGVSGLFIATMMAVLIGGTFPRPLGAQTSLQQALVQAYTTNPMLQAARAELRSVNQGLSVSRGGRYPRIEILGSVGPTGTKIGSADFDFTEDRFSVGLQVTQPIYQGGKIAASIAQAENQIKAQQQRLRLTQQTVLLQTAIAYLDVIRDQEVAKLRRNNENVLARQLEATRDRFEVGEITRTDVSLAESHLARATSERIQAEGQVIISQAAYMRTIGTVPELPLLEPQLDVSLPESLSAARELAHSNNPSLIAARYGRSIALNAIDIIDSGLWPQIGLSAGITQSRDQNDITSMNITAQITIPLYTSGIVSAQTRAARHTASQRQLEVSQVLREVEEATIQAWQSLLTTQAIIDSTKARIRAAKIASEGVEQEERVGSRTVLDILDAKQELLDAEVALAIAQRDNTVAIFSLLNVLGTLDVKTLQLDLPS